MITAPNSSNLAIVAEESCRVPAAPSPNPIDVADVDPLTVNPFPIVGVIVALTVNAFATTESDDAVGNVILPPSVTDGAVRVVVVANPPKLLPVPERLIDVVAVIDI